MDFSLGRGQAQAAPSYAGVGAPAAGASRRNFCVPTETPASPRVVSRGSKEGAPPLFAQSHPAGTRIGARIRGRGDQKGVSPRRHEAQYKAPHTCGPALLARTAPAVDHCLPARIRRQCEPSGYPERAS